MKFGDLRGILQYVPQFRGRTFVIALDGAVMASENFSNILLNLAVLRSLNVNLVLVHGAACQIESLAKRRGVNLSSRDATGPTDDETLEVALDAITRLGSDVMRDLTALKIRTVTANVITAHAAGIIGGVDQCHTGKMDRVDHEMLEGFLEKEILPLLPPLGYDGGGHTLRMNSDQVAVAVGVALRADKIIFVTDQEPDFGLDLQSARQISADQGDDLLEKAELDQVCAGLRSKLQQAIRACREGVSRVHLINGNRDDALLAELFSNEGIGTMVFADDYRRIRPATPADVDEMLLMMRRAVADEQLVERNKAEVLARLQDYLVMEIDGNVVGVGALHVYAEEKAAELACIYVKDDHEGQGYGRELVETLEEKAKSLGISWLFMLSTQTSAYFASKFSYRESSDLSSMPTDRRQKWEQNGRNARFLVKEL
ncbi:MAG: amino-acid N-acetyltransferase [Verrucomicrobiales bacterium]|nr:amino-acid N-acetyltransferase [Verrucomicrobiales bacterium]